MSIEIYSNNASTTLASAINATAVSLSVLSGTGAEFPNPTAGQFFRLTLNDALTGAVFEVLYCTSRSGDTLSVQRGQEGTTAHSWVSGDKVFAGPTAGAMGNLAQQVQVQENVFNYAVDSGSANAYVVTLTPTNLSTPVPGAVINWLAANANTGPSTVQVNGGSVYPLLGPARTPLQGGEVGAFCTMTFDAAFSSYVLVNSTGGAPQVPSTVNGSNQTPSLGQIQAQFAALNGNAAKQFAASQLNTGVVSAASSLLNLLSNVGVGVTNVAGTAFEPVSCAPSANGNQATIQNQFTIVNDGAGMYQLALPGGWVIKFGIVVTNPAGVVGAAYANPFPHTYLGGVTTYLTNGTNTISVFSGICTTSSRFGIVVNAQSLSGGVITPVNGANVYYITWGN